MPSRPWAAALSLLLAVRLSWAAELANLPLPAELPGLPAGGPAAQAPEPATALTAAPDFAPLAPGGLASLRAGDAPSLTRSLSSIVAPGRGESRGAAVERRSSALFTGERATRALAVPAGAGSAALGAPASPASAFTTDDWSPSRRDLGDRIPVSANSFRLTDRSEELVLDVGLGLPEEQRDLLRAGKSKIEASVLGIVLSLRANGWSKKRKLEFAKRFEKVLKSHFNATLARHRRRTTRRNGLEVHEVEDGVRFWSDFVSAPDPESRIAAEVFLQNSPRKVFSRSFPMRLVASVADGIDVSTRILRDDQLSAGQWESLARLAEERGASLARHGRYAIVGRGTGFQLAHDVLLKARRLEDPGSAARFERVARHLAAEGVPIEFDHIQGVAAFFDGSRIAFVIPSRADLNALAHEGTHARFHRFEERLQSWLGKRRLAVPYRLDGPPVGLFQTFGAFMNLLNELNAWRVGESMDGKADDKAILRTLKDSYGRQAGQRSARLFSKLWPARRVEGRSVPRLIRDGVLALNRGDPAEVGRKALAERDEAGQFDFLLLVAARHEPGKAPAPLAEFLERLRRRGASPAVRRAAERLSTPKPDEAEAPDAGDAVSQAFDAEKDAWLEGFLGERVRVLPYEIRYGGGAVLLFMKQTGLTDYDGAIRGMQKRFGGDRVIGTAEERAGIEAVLTEAGATIDEKLRAYLERFNGRGFEAVWREFEREPTSDLSELLVEKHLASLEGARVLELFRWALDRSRETLAKRAAELLGELFDRTGLKAIHAEASRAPSRSRPALSRELDGLLARRMFDGKPGSHRLEVINLLVERTHPEELPRLHRRLLRMITDDDVAPEDLWVARAFLMSESGWTPRHARWGESVARAVLADETPSRSALEFVGEFYRMGLGAALPGPEWGKLALYELDARLRNETLKAMSDWGPSKRKRHKTALDDLWRLLGEKAPQAGVAALYAIASRPVYLLGLEDRLAAEARGPPNERRSRVLRLAAMLRPGFSPKLDQAVAEAKDLTPDERSNLKLRNPPSSQLPQ